MGAGISSGLSFAVAAALSPIAIGAVVVVLATPRGRLNGPAFLAGWTLGLFALGSVALFVITQVAGPQRGGPATWALVLQLVLAVALLALAAQQWQSRPRPGAPVERPAWLAALDQLPATRALGGGAVLAVANPKNAALTIAAATAIADADVAFGGSAAGLAAFVAVGSLGIAVPVALYFAAGARSERVLDRLRDELERHSARVVSVLLVFVAALLIVTAAREL